MECFENINLKKVAIQLYEINAIKFGNFKLKTGNYSPIYVDLRVIISYPKVMDMLTDLLMKMIEQNDVESKILCGVPYTALPIAAVLAHKMERPTLIRRKEAKDYGTKKLIEGKFDSGDNCLIIEDIVTSGSSILETVKDLRNEGLKITDAIVIVDREQGGKHNIEANGVKLHSLFNLSDLINLYSQENKITEQIASTVREYIASNQVVQDGIVKSITVEDNEYRRTKMPFLKRAAHSKCFVAKELFELMATKETNLCIAADLTSAEAILNLADLTGPYICVLKLHIDIVSDFDMNFINSLQTIAAKHRFLLMEDRKFADIGNTVKLQYSNGMYHIGNWADLVTAHSLPGVGLVQAIQESFTADKPQGIFLLAEMSSSGNLITPKYVEATKAMAINPSNENAIAGLVAQSVETVESPGLIQLTPGVKIAGDGDNLGQQYNTPEKAVIERGGDICVVGRGIFKAKDIVAAAQMYKTQLWNAYLKRISN